jgi:bifunctional DNase/RNase
MHIEMLVTGLTIDPVNNAPIVVLREKEGERILPIWIGVIEASAIAFELEQVKLTRPMTHDLLKNAIAALEGTVERVAVVDLVDNTYYATLFIERSGTTIEIDARPSDAIALALRTNAPIWCEARVLERAHVQQEEWEARTTADSPRERASDEEEERGEGGPKPIVEDGSKSLRELLEDLDPEDFGKYKM